MNLNSFRTLLCKGGALLICGAMAIGITGCGVGSTLADNSSDTIVPGFSGVLHGGPTPVVGARVVIYATTSTAYGTGQVLQEATQVGSSAHQDTNSSGTFSFAGGFTCPAGQYAYIVAYGGNTGSNSTNPNLVLMTALGACSSLYSGTTYTGSNVLVNELTTVAAAYALSNFISVAGSSTSGYTVGIGSDSTNNGNSSGKACVANTYYTTTLGIPCTTTSAAGMGHAFANAAQLVNINTGVANSTTTNGAIIPIAEINSIGNIMQSCVNSNGGGTTSGSPNTTITSSGTSNDGTICGEFFSYSSYTTNGLQTGGTLVTAGNTLSAAINMAKHPTGSPSTFNTTCTSNSTGSTTAATCLYNLASANGFYNSALASAPPDWSIAIYYPKGSFSSTANSTACSGSTPATTGILYPYMLATDINDNLVIANGDANTAICTNVIYIGFDGTPIGATAFDSTGALLNWISTDDFGHAIVPVHGTGGTANANNGVRIYSVDSSGVSLLNTYESATSAAANLPYYTGVDQNDTIWIAAQNAANDLGWLALSGSNSHSSPTYTGGATSTAVTTSMTFASIDVNGNVFSNGTSSGGSERVRVIPAQIPSSSTNATQGATSTEATSPSSNTTSNGELIVPDTAGNAWTIVTTPASTTAAQGSPIADLAYSTAYTSTSGVFSAFATSSTEYVGSTSSEYDYSIKGAAIDGNGVIWWGDLQGSGNATTLNVYPGYLHGFDTVNKIYLPIVNGCQFAPSTSFTVSSSVIGGSSTVFTMSSTTNPPAAGTTITLSGFPSTSSFYNNQSVTIASNTVGSGSTNSTFTVNNTFSQSAGSDSDAGTATAAADSTHCGSITADASFPSNQPYSFYGVRGVAVDSAGDVWTANGTQGHITEVIGIAAPTWPMFIHNGTSNKP